MFITFEGIDGSGKTTQARLLAERLKEEGHDCIFLREPGGTEISEKVRVILLDRDHLEMSQLAELFLFSAARTQLVSEVILPAIQSGRIVICDRFYDSTTAYQGYGRSLDLTSVKQVNAIATLNTVPDLTLILDIEVKEIGRRQGSRKLNADRMESAGVEFFERVRRGYTAIARSDPQRCRIVDGMRSVEEVHGEIWNIVREKL